MINKLLFFSVTLLFSIKLFAIAPDSLVNNYCRKFVFLPYYCDISIPAGSFNQIAKLSPALIIVEYEPEYFHQFGLIFRFGFTDNGEDTLKVSNYYRDKVFSSNLNRQLVFTKGNFSTSANCFFSCLVSYNHFFRKKIRVSLFTGLTCMELDNLLYGDSKAFISLYYRKNDTNDYYGIDYKYNKVPIFSFDFGYSLDYMFNKVVGVSLQGRFTRAKSSMTIEAHSQQISNYYYNSFSENRIISIINLGLGVIVKLK